MNKYIITIITIVGIFIIVGVGYSFSQSSTADAVVQEDHHEDEDDVVEDYEIYPGDAVDKIINGENVILLDVRTLEEYEQIHLKNALLLPVQELSQISLDAVGLGEDAKNKEIIIYCRSGARSKTAYDIMNSLGYTNIKSVAGGMVHWEEDEYPHTEVGEYVQQESIFSSDTDARAPKITFDRTLHDFGVIPQFGGVVEVTFKVKNEGNETLVIGPLSTSCACTSAEISETDILAGGEATLTVYFDPDLHAEPLDVFKRTIFIPTNDPNTPEAEITIKVDIDEGK